MDTAKREVVDVALVTGPLCLASRKLCDRKARPPPSKAPPTTSWAKCLFVPCIFVFVEFFVAFNISVFFCACHLRVMLVV